MAMAILVGATVLVWLLVALVAILYRGDRDTKDD